MWRKKHPERAANTGRNNYAKRKRAEGRHTVADIKRIRGAQKDKCAVCRTKLRGAGHVDHIVPLSGGGTNWTSNLQLLCEGCNLSKHARNPIEFMQSRGFLL
jgi:5-methylcytosine-specific restriction endonuclease McrA